MKTLILSFTLLMTSIVPGFSQKDEDLSPAHSLFAILAGREQSLSGAFRPQFWRRGYGLTRRSTGPETSMPGDGQLVITLSNIPIMLVRSKPYSAEETIQETGTRSIGTQKSNPPQSAFIYRDAAGRTRIDWPACYRFPSIFSSSYSNLNLAPNTNIAPNNIVPSNILDLIEIMGGSIGSDCLAGMSPITEINDPVAGYRYYLDSLYRVAYRFSLPLSAVYLPSSIPPKPLQYEFLGVKTIAGVDVQGARFSTTIDKAIVTTESWISNELMIGVHRKSFAPNRGEIIQTLKNIKRAEPDAALFKIPSDYKIVDGPK
jgi:hypothetical protein